VLGTWAAVLTGQAADLVDAGTVAEEASAVAQYFPEE
jgi:hypothetical protein